MSNVKTIYPPTKFVKENVLSAQLKHFYSEIKEIRRAQFAYQHNPTPETLRHLIEEVQDSIHSGETLCRIAMAKLDVDVAGVQQGIVEKNRRRGHYAGNGYPRCPGCKASLCGRDTCVKCESCNDDLQMPCSSETSCFIQREVTENA